MDAIRKMDEQFDASKLQQHLDTVLYANAIDHETQILLTHQESQANIHTRWTSGAGTLKGSYTREYANLDKEFFGTYVEEVVSAVRGVAWKWGFQVGRVRLLTLLPKTCYTLHKDPDECRFHIPLVTNPNTFFVSGAEMGRMTIPGRLYWFRTQDYHTAVNASFEKRTHLVFDTFSDPSFE